MGRRRNTLQASADGPPRQLPARALYALSEFFRLEAAGGIVLIVAAALALLVANSPLQDLYVHFRDLRCISDRRAGHRQAVAVVDQ